MLLFQGKEPIEKAIARYQARAKGAEFQIGEEQKGILLEQTEIRNLEDRVNDLLSEIKEHESKIGERQEKIAGLQKERLLDLERAEVLKQVQLPE